MKVQRIILSSLLIFFVFYLFFLAGILFPESWWSTHFLFFIPLKKRAIILFISALAPFVFIYLNKILLPNSKTVFSFGKNKNWYILIISVLIGILQYIFPMVFDYYGEAVKLQKYLEIIPDAIPGGTNDALFAFSLSPWAGQNTILAIVTYIAYWTGSTYQQAFYLMDAVSGALFSFTWLMFLDFYLKNKGTKLVLSVAGLASPFMLIFFGHIEIYGPVFLSNLLWLVLALVFLKRGKPAYLIILGVLLLWCMKLHAVALLFTPVFILLLLHYFKPEFVKKFSIFSWNKSFVFIIFPIVLIGAFSYFFLFKDYNDPRDIQYTVKQYDRLFLPLISPEPPLDKYNLLSWNHIFDYFNEILLWSPGILFLILISVIPFRKKINWNTPDIIISGISLILFVLLFFMVNPLLSMQMDWDLFVMPAPILLVFGAVIIGHVEDEISRPVISGSVAGIILLTLPLFMVHRSEILLAKRIELVGVRIFKTYYEWAGQTLELAWSHLPEKSPDEQHRRTEVIKQLKHYSIPWKDYEYARIISQQAKIAIRVNSNPEEGLKLLKEAESYFPELNIIQLYKLEAYFLLKNYNNAYKISEKLIQMAYPSEEKALRISVHCALEAEMYDEALEKSEIYVQQFGKKGVVNKVNKGLKSKENIKELKLLFSQGQ